MQYLQSIGKQQVERFEPRADWFYRGPIGIHGLGHETRVLIWTQVLATSARNEGLSADTDVVGCAAAIHDTQRWNDGIDADHGARAARWIEKNPQLLPENVPLERVAYLCRWHVPSDYKAPEMTDELKIFKDADALDRWRIGDLDPTYLRTKTARQILDASLSLWSATFSLSDSENLFQQIIDIAVQQEILIDE